MEFPDHRLLVFAKAPVPGRVKTRLAGHLGNIGATRLYRRMLWQTLEMAVGADLCPVELWCAPTRDHPFFRRCRRELGVSLHRQQGADLGARMARAFSEALEHARGALVIGGDCASVDSTALRQSLGWLDGGVPAVLGPAEDGGYVLLGLARPAPGLFRRMPWSTARVLPLTRRRLRASGLAWRELSMGFDVDDPASLRRLRRLRAAQGKDSVV